MASVMGTRVRQVTLKVISNLSNDTAQRVELYIDGVLEQVEEYKPHLDALTTMLVFVQGYMTTDNNGTREPVPFTLKVTREWVNSDGNAVDVWERGN